MRSASSEATVGSWHGEAVGLLACTAAARSVSEVSSEQRKLRGTHSHAVVGDGNICVRRKETNWYGV